MLLASPLSRIRARAAEVALAWVRCLPLQRRPSKQCDLCYKCLQEAINKKAEETKKAEDAKAAEVEQADGGNADDDVSTAHATAVRPFVATYTLYCGRDIGARFVDCSCNTWDILLHADGVVLLTKLVGRIWLSGPPLSCARACSVHGQFCIALYISGPCRSVYLRLPGSMIVCLF